MHNVKYDMIEDDKKIRALLTNQEKFILQWLRVFWQTIMAVTTMVITMVTTMVIPFSSLSIY